MGMKALGGKPSATVLSERKRGEILGFRGNVHRIGELASFYWAQRVKGFSVPDEPLLDEGATAALRSHLDKARFYLEFGTGGSTVLVARRGLETVSVDSDPVFAQAVRRKLAPGHRVTIVDTDIGLTAEWGFPVLKRETPARLARWRRYIDQPFAIIAARGRFPDFVLVDGRFRVGCTLESARQAVAAGSPTTIMVDDYQGREHYRLLEDYLGPPRREGRAALFDMGTAPLPRPVTAACVSEAMRDPR